MRFEGYVSRAISCWGRGQVPGAVLVVGSDSVSVAFGRRPFPQKTVVWKFADGPGFARQRVGGRYWVGLRGCAQREWTWLRTSQSDVMAHFLLQAGI